MDCVAWQEDHNGGALAPEAMATEHASYLKNRVLCVTSTLK